MPDRNFFYFRVAVAERVQHFPHIDIVQDDCPGGKIIQLAALKLWLLFQPADVIARAIYGGAARVARVSVENLEFICPRRVEEKEDCDADRRLGEPGCVILHACHMILRLRRWQWWFNRCFEPAHDTD